MGAVGGLVHMTVASAIMGYIAMSAKDATKGNTPRDPTSKATWVAAIMQGGGAGILGDFLFGQYSRFGQNLSETLMGPTLGTGVNTIFDIYNRLKDDKPVSAELLNTVLDNTPMINTLGLRTALNYLFLYRVQEWMSPGFMQRHTAFLAKQGQHSYLPPASVH